MLDDGTQPVPAALLWTIMAPEKILAGWHEPRPGELEIRQGQRILMVSNHQGRRRVTRLISTDPLDYLHDGFAPDSELP